MTEKSEKIRKLKTPIKLNLGIVIFGLILIYLFINIVISITTEKTLYYEVVAGSNSEYINSTYTGIALRKEQIAYAETSGYIDYFVRESSRISKNTTLYSIDSSGKLNEQLLSIDNNNLTDKDIDTIKELLSTFSNNYNNMDFSDVYNFKSSIKGTLIDLFNMNALEELAKESENNFSINKSNISGIVLYGVDNYETINKDSLNENLFNKENYTLASFSSGDQIDKGSPIYKTITDEQWSIAIQLTTEDVKKYKDTSKVNIKFLKDSIETSGYFEIIKGTDGKQYGIISLSQYLINYSNDRFIDIQILDNVTYGLKVPKSSVVEKELYAIPTSYGEKGLNSNKIGFSIQSKNTSDDTREIYYPRIIHSTDEYFYVSTDSFKDGDVLLGYDTHEKFIIGQKQKFMGVYNINNGYTIFVVVKVLEEMDEYYILSDDPIYDLIQYDRIVLDGNTVEENQIIFQ